MKKTENLMFAILGIAVSLSSCSSNDAALKEKQATIDSLTAIISGKTIAAESVMAMAAAGPDTSLLSNPIEYADAYKHIHTYRNYISSNTSMFMPYAWYFEKSQIVDLLDQSNCIGLKLYASISEVNGKQTLTPVAIGVKAGTGTDKYLDMIDTTNFKALNMSKFCPNMCDPYSEFGK